METPRDQAGRHRASQSSIARERLKTGAKGTNKVAAREHIILYATPPPIATVYHQLLLQFSVSLC